MIERFRLWYEHERHCNSEMIGMLESVPESARGDARFQAAVDYAHHLAACRENWLDRMQTGASTGDWFPGGELDSLHPRFEKIEARWTEYLASLTDDELERDFEFGGNDSSSRWRWNIEGQIVQLVGHAFYHRGMIAMIVDELGGEKVDTDYLFWAYGRSERWGKI